MNKYIARQGDVLITLVENIPAKLELKKDLVLAEGEMKGHAHRITKGQAELFINATLGLMYLKVLSDTAELFHEEHSSIVLPMGDYEIGQQKEFDWFSEEIRRVVD